jgi:hypothetical protein
MYTGRLIESLINTVEQCEQGKPVTRPITVKMAPRVEVGRAQMQAFFYQMHAAGLIQPALA